MSNLNLHNINFTVNTDETIDGFVTKRTKSDFRSGSFLVKAVRIELTSESNSAGLSPSAAKGLDFGRAIAP